MIQQSTAPVAASWLTAPCEPSDRGPGIRVVAGVISFFKALHPDYASGSLQMELPTLCADPSGKGCHSALERTELAARMVCACAGLPVDVVSCIGGAANISAVVRWVGSHLAGADSVVSRDDNSHSQAHKKQRHVKACSAKTAIGLSAASCLGVVGAAPVPDHGQWIEVNNSSVLDKIGRDPAYPLNGSYRQHADIDASDLSGPIGSESQPFVGEYDGGCHSIDKLKHCFIQKLDGNGRIVNVRIVRGEIYSLEKAGLVACELSGRAALGNIRVEHSEVLTDGNRAPAGLGVGVVSRYAPVNINGFSAFNCSTRTGKRESHAGGIAGVAYGTIDNSRLERTMVETLGEGSNAGGVAGEAYGTLNNTVIIDGTIFTYRSEANAGGGAGVAASGANIDNTVLVATDLTADGFVSRAGGGAGMVKSKATVANTLLINSTLRAKGIAGAAAGGGGGVHGTVNDTTMIGGGVETDGRSALAAVGAGEVYPRGKVFRTTGQRVLVRTVGRNSEAAVGAGLVDGVVEGVVCFGSNVETTNSYSDAGIGAGRLVGSVVGVVAYDCRVGADGYRSDAGFGSGSISSWPKGRLRNLTVMYGRAYASGRGASAIINGGNSPFVCSSSVGDKYKSPPCCNNSTEKPCLPIPEDACKLADRRVLTRDCQPVAPPYYDAEKGYDVVCPALPTPGAGGLKINTLSSTISVSTPTTDASTTTTSVSTPTTDALTTTTSVPTPTTDALTTTTSVSTPTTDASTTTTSASTPTTPIATTPETTSQAFYILTTPTLPVANATSVATVNMTNSTMPFLIPATAPVPLVLKAPAAMSTGALAGGIVAGVVAVGLVGVAGFAFYRYCHKQNVMAEAAIPLTDLDYS